MTEHSPSYPVTTRPVAWMVERKSDPTFPRLFDKESDAIALLNYVNVNPPCDMKPLYDHPAQASREAVIEECARVVEPKGPRPCQCDRCFCGNIGDVEAVAAWDADMANARAIRALALSSTDTGGAA